MSPWLRYQRLQCSHHAGVYFRFSSISRTFWGMLSACSGHRVPLPLPPFSTLHPSLLNVKMAQWLLRATCRSVSVPSSTEVPCRFMFEERSRNCKERLSGAAWLNGKARGFGIGRVGFEARLCHLLALWPWVCGSISLSLYFPILKNEKHTPSVMQTARRNK